MPQRTLSKPAAKHADGRDASLPRCFGIIGCVTDRDGVGAFELELLENDLEDVRCGFGFFYIVRGRFQVHQVGDACDVEILVDFILLGRGSNRDLKSSVANTSQQVRDRGEGTHKWQILGGFTVQRQKGVFGRGFSDQATSDNFTDPNNDINRNNNYLNLDATYVFKLDSTYELPWKIGTSVNFQHYTGFPLQPTDTFAIPDGNSPTPDIINESVILQPAGKLRLPSVNMLNLRVSREMVLNDRWHIIPTVDFFNVTNAQTVIGEVTTFGSSYLFPFSTINPFVMRFGLRFTF